MQNRLFDNKGKPLQTVVAAQPILTIIPAQMISAYVPYQSGLNLESAAKLALQRDEENADNFILSMKEA